MGVGVGGGVKLVSCTVFHSKKSQIKEFVVRTTIGEKLKFKNVQDRATNSHKVSIHSTKPNSLEKIESVQDKTTKVARGSVVIFTNISVLYRHVYFNTLQPSHFRY